MFVWQIGLIVYPRTELKWATNTKNVSKNSIPKSNEMISKIVGTCDALMKEFKIQNGIEFDIQ